MSPISELLFYAFIGAFSLGIDKKYAINPKPTDAFEGGVARFWCDIAAQPSPKIQWVKDNININQLTIENDRYKILPSGILQISPVQSNDTGLYWCNSRFNLELDKFGKIETSDKARLTVVPSPSYRPPKLLAAPRDVDVELGNSAILECLVDGNPLPKVEWRKRGSTEPIEDGGLYGHSNLVIQHVTLDHAGVYECLVVGPNGPSINVSAALNVLVPPKLTTAETQSFLLMMSMSKKIYCPVTGTPEPEFSWYYNGNRIEAPPGDSKLKIDQGGRILLLFNLLVTDSGFYQCIASNKAGVAILVSRLIVKNKESTAPETPRNVTAVAISSNKILVSIVFPPVSNYGLIKYQRAGESPKQAVLALDTVDLSKAYVKEINDLKPYTNYSVEVMALTKTDGVSDFSEKIFVQTDEDVPIAAPSLSLTNPNYHTILVSWTPLTPEQSRGKVVKYRIFYKAEDALEVLEDVPADQTSFYIRDVEPETTYYIQVQAATGAGFPLRNSNEAMKHVTPAVNASSPPRLTLKYINGTTVRLSWQSPASLASEDKVIGYNFNITNLSDETDKVPLKQFSVNASVHATNVTGLNPYDKYEVTLIAVMRTSFSGTSSRKFQLTTLKLQPEPWHFSVADITAHNISLVWTPVINGRVEYEVCYSKEDGTMDVKCNKTHETSWTVENLDPYTRYLFRARPLLQIKSEHFGKNLIVRTREDRPSPPVNLVVEVKEPKVVHLEWLPPLHKNGILKNYIVNYTKQEENGENMIWKSLIQKASSTSSVIDDLKVGRYLFTVIAVNSVGRSKPSQFVSAVPVCLKESESSCKSYEEPPETVNVPLNKKANLPTKALWIIGAFVCLIIFLVIGVIIFCFYKRSSRLQQPQETNLNCSHTPFFLGNGHVTPGPETGHHRPWNGHAGSPHGVGYGPGDAISPQEFAPMLNQIRQNVHLDSKGGTDSVIPNGIYQNGLTRPKPAFFEHQTAHKTSTFETEEYGGLMATIMENNRVKKAKHSTPNKNIEEISLSCLDSIDREENNEGNEEEDGDGDRLVDHSSEDSGTECRHASMLGSREDAFHAQSPASSSGGSSLDPQQESALADSLLVWEQSGGHDELGGHFIDRTTGAVIGPIASGGSSRSKAGKDGEGGIGDATDLKPGQTFFEDDDESACNDRDSGHGGEVKPQPNGAANSMCDSGHADLVSTMDIPHASSTPGDSHSLVHCLSSSPPRASSNSSQSQTVQQQLPLPSSRCQGSPGTTNHPNRLNTQNFRQPHIDLPLPPPPPPPQNSLLTSISSPASAAMAQVCDASSRGDKDDEEGQANADSSNHARQSPGKMDVGFLPPRPPPSPPNIA
ncbi:protogenin [Plakobranchus ocellatus]|uniref:Protogenin n=1 Tax=Plakobranchus ocellatus TaxID=259542 RepID=A0AAV4CJ94_9GAST|nr:protogenin [Plakobranchus ocellatus]